MENTKARRAYRHRRREVQESWTDEESPEEEHPWEAGNDPDTAWPDEEGDR